MASLTEERVLHSGSRVMSQPSDTARFHGKQILSQWHSLVRTRNHTDPVQLRGDSLDIPTFIAVARYVIEPSCPKP